MTHSPILLVFALLVAQTATEPVLEAPLTVRFEAAPPPTAAPLRLEIGTAIPLVLSDRLSTKTNVKGDLFAMTVAQDVYAGDRVAIPKGTRAIGELTRVETKGPFGRSGKLEARALYIELDGRTVRLSGALSARGEGGTTETVLTAIAVGTLAFVVTGRSAQVEPGTVVDAILDRPVVL